MQRERLRPESYSVSASSLLLEGRASHGNRGSKPGTSLVRRRGCQSFTPGESCVGLPRGCVLGAG